MKKSNSITWYFVWFYHRLFLFKKMFFWRSRHILSFIPREVHCVFHITFYPHDLCIFGSPHNFCFWWNKWCCIWTSLKLQLNKIEDNDSPYKVIFYLYLFENQWHCHTKYRKIITSLTSISHWPLISFYEHDYFTM